MRLCIPASPQKMILRYFISFLEKDLLQLRMYLLVPLYVEKDCFKLKISNRISKTTLQHHLDIRDTYPWRHLQLIGFLQHHLDIRDTYPWRHLDTIRSASTSKQKNSSVRGLLQLHLDLRSASTLKVQEFLCM